jgi:hypothetical protein
MILHAFLDVYRYYSYKKINDPYPTEYYKNIFKGSYNRKIKYIKKTSSRKKKLKNYL